MATGAILVNSLWGGLSNGAVVQYEGEDYIIGIDAFAVVADAVTAIPNTVAANTLVLIDGNYDLGTVNKNLKGDFAIITSNATVVSGTITLKASANLKLDGNITAAVTTAANITTVSGGNYDLSLNTASRASIFSGSGALTLRGTTLTGNLNAFSGDLTLAVTTTLSAAHTDAVFASLKTLSAVAVTISGKITTSKLNATGAVTVSATTGKLILTDESTIAGLLTNSGEITYTGTNPFTFAGFTNNGTFTSTNATALNTVAYTHNGTLIGITSLTASGALTVSAGKTLEIDEVTTTGAATIGITGSMTVKNLTTNTGTLTVNNGGVLTTNDVSALTGGMTVAAGGRADINAGFTIGGTLAVTGTGVLNLAMGKTLTINGNIAASTGTFNVATDAKISIVPSTGTANGAVTAMNLYGELETNKALTVATLNTFDGAIISGSAIVTATTPTISGKLTIDGMLYTGKDLTMVADSSAAISGGGTLRFTHATVGNTVAWNNFTGILEFSTATAITNFDFTNFGGSVTIISAAASLISDLTITSGKTLALAAGTSTNTVTFNAKVTIEGSLTKSGTTLAVGASGELVVNGTANVSALTVNGTVSGTGKITAAGTVTVNAGGIATIVDGSVGAITNNGTLNVTGTLAAAAITVSNGGSVVMTDIAVLNSAALTLGNSTGTLLGSVVGGTVNASGNVIVYAGSALSVKSLTTTGAATVSVTGELTADALTTGTGTVTVNVGGGANINGDSTIGGALAVAGSAALSGTSSITGNVIGAGVLTIGENAKITFSGAANNLTNAAADAFVLNGELVLAGASTTIASWNTGANSKVTGSGNLTFSGANVLNYADISEFTGDFIFSNASANISADFGFANFGGNVTVSGASATQFNSTIVLASDKALTFSNSATGTSAIVNGSVSGGTLSLKTRSNTISDTAVVDVATLECVTYGVINNGTLTAETLSVTGTITNNGTFSAVGGTAVAITNNGTLNVTGTLATGAITQNAALNVSGTLSAAAVTVSNGGSIVMTDDAVLNSAALTLGNSTGTLLGTVTGGTVNASGNVIVYAGSALSVKSLTTTGAATVSVTGELTADALTTGTGLVTVNANGALTVGGGSAAAITVSTGGTLSLNGNTAISGALTVNGTGTATLNGNVTVEGSVTGAGSLIFGAGVNKFSVGKSGVASSFTAVVAGEKTDLEILGNVTVSKAVIESFNGVTIADGATMTINSTGHRMTLDMNTISGSGTITTAANTVVTLLNYNPAGDIKLDPAGLYRFGTFDPNDQTAMTNWNWHQSITSGAISASAAIATAVTVGIKDTLIDVGRTRYVAISAGAAVGSELWIKSGICVVNSSTKGVVIANYTGGMETVVLGTVGNKSLSWDVRAAGSNGSSGTEAFKLYGEKGTNIVIHNAYVLNIYGGYTGGQAGSITYNYGRSEEVYGTGGSVTGDANITINDCYAITLVLGSSKGQGIASRTLDGNTYINVNGAGNNGTLGLNSGYGIVTLLGGGIASDDADDIITGNTNITIAGGKIGSVIGGGQRDGENTAITKYHYVTTSYVKGASFIHISEKDSVNYSTVIGVVAGGGMTAANKGSSLAAGHTVIENIGNETYATNIVVTGGLINNGICGGGIVEYANDSYANTAVILGNTLIDISGGTVNGKIGGGGGVGTLSGYTLSFASNNSNKTSTISGDTYINISGTAQVGATVYGGGGGKGSKVTGSSNITISGGTITGDIYAGGSTYSVLDGNANITISGGTITGNIYGGGHNNATVGGDSILTFNNTNIFNLAGNVSAFNAVNFKGKTVNFGQNGDFTNTRINITVTAEDLEAITKDSPYIVATFSGAANYTGSTFTLNGFTPVGGIITINGNDYGINSESQKLSIVRLNEPPSMHVTLNADTVNRNDFEYSLREAIIAYSDYFDDKIITFDTATNGTAIDITEGAITIGVNKEITLKGNGADQTVITGRLGGTQAENDVIAVAKDGKLYLRDIWVSAPILVMAGGVLSADVGSSIVDAVQTHPAPATADQEIMVATDGIGNLTVNGINGVAITNTSAASLVLQNGGKSMTLNGTVEAALGSGDVIIFNIANMTIASELNSSIANYGSGSVNVTNYGVFDAVSIRNENDGEINITNGRDAKAGTFTLSGRMVTTQIGEFKLALYNNGNDHISLTNTRGTVTLNGGIYTAHTASGNVDILNKGTMTITSDETTASIFNRGSGIVHVTNSGSFTADSIRNEEDGEVIIDNEASGTITLNGRMVALDGIAIRTVSIYSTGADAGTVTVTNAGVMNLNGAIQIAVGAQADMIIANNGTMDIQSHSAETTNNERAALVNFGSGLLSVTNTDTLTSYGIRNSGNGRFEMVNSGSATVTGRHLSSTLVEYNTFNYVNAGFTQAEFQDLLSRALIPFCGGQKMALEGIGMGNANASVNIDNSASGSITLDGMIMGVIQGGVTINNAGIVEIGEKNNASALALFNAFGNLTLSGSGTTYGAYKIYGDITNLSSGSILITAGVGSVIGVDGDYSKVSNYGGGNISIEMKGNADNSGVDVYADVIGANVTITGNGKLYRVVSSGNLTEEQKNNADEEVVVSVETAEFIGGISGVNETIAGSTNVVISNNAVASCDVYAGGQNVTTGGEANVGGSTTLSVDTITINGNMYGGGNASSVGQTATVTVTNSSVTDSGKIVGGGNNGGVVSGDITISLNTVTAAAASTIIGGGVNSNVGGKVAITVSNNSTVGGSLIGGGQGGDVGGGVVLTIAASSVNSGSGAVLVGGGSGGKVTGDIAVNITDSTVKTATVIGGGLNGAVTGAVSMTIASSTVTANIVGGGSGAAGTVNGNITLNIGQAPAAPSGRMAMATFGTTTIDTTVTGNVYGGGYDGNVIGGVTLNVTNASVEKYIFGGSVNGSVGGLTTLHLNSGSVNNVIGGGAANGSGKTAESQAVSLEIGAITMLKSNSSMFGGGYASGGGNAIAGTITITANSADAMLYYLYGGGWSTGVNSTSTTGAVTMSISDGTAQSYVYGAGRAEKGATSTAASVEMKISGGTFASNVIGGGYAADGSKSTVTGNVDITITGGSFAASIFGGGQIEQGGAKTGVANVNGNISITLDCSGANKINLTNSSNIFLAGAGTTLNGGGTVQSSSVLTMTLKGESANLSSGSYSGTISGAGGSNGGTAANRILVFDNFSGNLNAKLAGFTEVHLLGNSAVNMTNNFALANGTDYTFDLQSRDAGLSDTAMYSMSSSLGVNADSNFTVTISWDEIFAQYELTGSGTGSFELLSGRFATNWDESKFGADCFELNYFDSYGADSSNWGGVGASKGLTFYDDAAGGINLWLSYDNGIGANIKTLSLNWELADLGMRSMAMSDSLDNTLNGGNDPWKNGNLA